jgi:hypothetical protein
MRIKDIVEALSDKKADEFHTKLDKLVHDYIGHSSDEKKEKAALKKGKSEEVDEATEKRWKQTSMSPDQAIAAYGKDRVRVKKGALRSGDDMVEVLVESIMMTEEQFDEAAGEKDACYHKVKSRYKVWPSAYASGALVQCRKVGAKNWGNKSK